MTSSVERLERLFSGTRPRGGERVTDEQVAEGVRAGGAGHHGIPLAAAQLTAFRAGDHSAISAHQLAAVAVHFGVPSTYFVNDEVAAAVDTQLGYLERLRDAGWTYDALSQALSARSPLAEDTIRKSPELLVDALVVATDRPVTPQPGKRRWRPYPRG